MAKMTLKAARVNAGLTQKEVAEKLGVSNNTVCAWENGKSIPSVLMADRLCTLYMVEIDDLNFLPGNPLLAD